WAIRRPVGDLDAVDVEPESGAELKRDPKATSPGERFAPGSTFRDPLLTNRRWVSGARASREACLADAPGERIAAAQIGRLTIVPTPRGVVFKRASSSSLIEGSRSTAQRTLPGTRPSRSRRRRSRLAAAAARRQRRAGRDL